MWDGTEFVKVISATEPDNDLIYNKDDKNFLTKYLGAIFVLNRTIYPIHKSGAFYSFDIPINILIAGSTSYTQTDLAVDQLIPLKCQKVRLRMVMNSQNTGSQSTFNIGCPGGPERSYIMQPAGVSGQFSQDSVSIDLPLVGTVIRAKTQFNSPVNSASIFLEGMWET
jgi:hypothetical protein